jgi:hypothetical protein
MAMILWTTLMPRALSRQNCPAILYNIYDAFELTMKEIPPKVGIRKIMKMEKIQKRGILWMEKR